jgi:hypothetical protein
MRGTLESAGPGNKPAWLSGDSVLWLILAAGLFLVAELTPNLLRMPLGADEITYIAQTSAHASAVMLPPVHGHGAGLLAAPVTLLTTSLLVLRIWMSVLSGLGLFLAMLAWRGLRPAWVIAVAGLILGCLCISQLSGVQVYPDWWAALGALFVTGVFLQLATGRKSGWGTLSLLAAGTFLIVLMRPQNIAFVLAPAIGAALIVPSWRKLKVLAAFAIGIVAGVAEWVAEAFAWYGGLASRIHLATQEPPKFALYFSLRYQLRVLNGPWYCLPGQCHGWAFPWVSIWWLALLAFVILGIVVTWRTSARASSVLAAVSGLWVIACYTAFVPIAAPRYFLPAFALLAIPAADAVRWLATVPRWRSWGVVLACAFLLTGVVAQRLVLQAQVKVQDRERDVYISKARQLRAVGIHPPCVIGSPSVAYYAGCGAPWTGEHVDQLLARMPGGVNAWRMVNLRQLNQPGTPYYAWVPSK